MYFRISSNKNQQDILISPPTKSDGDLALVVSVCTSVPPYICTSVRQNDGFLELSQHVL